MDHYYFLQILFIVFLILSLTSGRTLFYDEDKERQNSQLKMSNLFPDNDISYEEREFHQRSVLSTSSASQTRQQLIDLLRKAYHQGWKPNLKHYIPATRFGRHHG